MEYYLSPGAIFGALLMGLYVTFFYIYGENERPPGLRWALISFGIWFFLSMLLRCGLILQLLGQAIYFGILTWYNINHQEEAKITR